MTILMNKGKLITLSGLDGAGKTTCVKLLQDKLIQERYDCYMTHSRSLSPLYTEMIQITKLVGRPMHHVFSPVHADILALADFEQNVEKVVAPLLKEKDIVLLDRYIVDALVHTLVWDGYYSFAQKVVASMPKPDLSIFIDVKPEDAYRRIQQRNSEPVLDEEMLILMKKYQMYLQLKEEYNLVFIESENTPEKTVETIYEYIDQKLHLSISRNEKIS